MQKPSTMVFKAGTWKGDTYSNEDLKGTVGSYNRTVVEAPWVVGHAISAGDPAAGWIRSLVYQEDAQGVGEIWAKSDFNSLGKKIGRAHV